MARRPRGPVVSTLPSEQDNFHYDWKIIITTVVVIFAIVFIIGLGVIFVKDFLLTNRRTEYTPIIVPGLSTDLPKIESITINDPNKTETVPFNSVRVPLENCNGSDVVQTTYKDSQTFTYDYTVDWTSGLEISVSAQFIEFAPKLEAKFGHSIGTENTREIETVLRALPGTNQTYIVTWNEIWKVGTATINISGKTFDAPYKVRTDIVHQIKTEAGVCP